jgi:hypothetical protein
MACQMPSRELAAAAPVARGGLKLHREQQKDTQLADISAKLEACNRALEASNAECKSLENAVRDAAAGSSFNQLLAGCHVSVFASWSQ